MPHIVLRDENGNVIGEEPHDPGSGGRHAEEDHDERTVILNVAEMCKLHGIKQKKDKDDD